MSGTAQLAAEELKRFAASFRNVLDLADKLAGMEDPDALQANILRLKQQSGALIENYRKQAEAEVERNMKSAVDAAQAKAKAVLDQAEQERTTILSAARAEAASIISVARKEGEALTRKYQAAHAAAQEAMR